MIMVGELPPEVSDDGLDGATIDSSESTDDTSSSDPADESDEDGGQSLAESARCAGQCAGCPAPNMKSDVALIIAGEFGRCPKISVNDWLSSSLAHIGESPLPGTTPRESREAIFRLRPSG